MFSSHSILVEKHFSIKHTDLKMNFIPLVNFQLAVRVLTPGTHRPVMELR